MVVWQATATTFESFFAFAFVACIILFAICICCLACSGFWSPILESTLGLCGFGLRECCACFGTGRGRRRGTGTTTAVAKVGAAEPAEVTTTPGGARATTAAYARRGGGGGGGVSIPWALTCGYCCGLYQPARRPPPRPPPKPDDDTEEEEPPEAKVDITALIAYQHMPLLRL